MVDKPEALKRRRGGLDIPLAADRLICLPAAELMYRGGLDDKAMPAVGMTWLPQCQSDPGVALLRDYPAEVVSIECDTCGWVDRYRLVALVARFGPAAKLSDVLFVLSTDC